MLASKTWHIGMAMDTSSSCPGLLGPESFGTRGRFPLAARLDWGSQDREEAGGTGMRRCLWGKRQVGWDSGKDGEVWWDRMGNGGDRNRCVALGKAGLAHSEAGGHG